MEGDDGALDVRDKRSLILGNAFFVALCFYLENGRQGVKMVSSSLTATVSA